MATLASWTYWNSEFTVVGLRRRCGSTCWCNDDVRRFRNTILLANGIGLIGDHCFDRAAADVADMAVMLATYAGLNHGSGLIELAADPYAAMPSLHAADALIVGLVLLPFAATARPACWSFLGLAGVVVSA